MGKRRKSRFKPFAVVAVVCVALVAFITVMLVQAHKLNCINAQINAARELQVEMSIEEQKLHLILAYMESKYFAYEYARHRLGYVLPGEVLLLSE